MLCSQYDISCYIFAENSQHVCLQNSFYVNARGELHYNFQFAMGLDTLKAVFLHFQDILHQDPYCCYYIIP